MLITPSVDPVAKIIVVGVGGGGGNTINTMISEYDVPGIECMAFNTDLQDLKKSLAPTTLQLGAELTRGLGVGGDHNLGAQAAEESLDEIQEKLSGADMVFITAGMGGGTGTGAAPIIAGVAKNLGALTVAVVTKPFSFEGAKRMEVAEEGIAELKDKVDTLIVIPNQRLVDLSKEDIPFREALKRVDRVLIEGVKSISGLITQTGFINVDFADVKSIMENAGTSLMGIGAASGENRAEEATRMATNSPLLDMSIAGAKGVLFNVVGGSDLTLHEVNTAAELIREAVDPNAKIIFGSTTDETIQDGELRITVVATGFDNISNQSSVSQESSDKQSPAVSMSSTSVEDITKSFVADSSPNSKPEINKTDQNPVKLPNSVAENPDDLDVPSFLRRK